MQGTYYIRNPETNLPAVVAYLTADTHDNCWWLNRIEVMRGTAKGQGYGTRLLEHVCREADHNEVQLVLGVDPDERGYFKRLARWYTRHGFTPVKRPLNTVNNMMIRKPHAIEAGSSQTDIQSVRT